MQKTNAANHNLRGTLIAAATIVMAGLVAYWPGFSGKFYLDDESAILTNPHLHQLSPIWPIIVPPGWMATLAGRPLLSLSLALNWAWGGDSVLGYHVVNFVIHATAGILLWLILHRLLLLPSISERLRRSAWWLASVAALLWTLHPLQTESVTYIVQRAECMAGMFFLLSVYFFLRGALAENNQTRGWYIGSVIACLLAIGTKESGAMIPLAILLMDRAFLSGDWKQCFCRGRGFLYPSLFGTWLFQIMLMISSNKRGSTAGFGLGISSWDYAVSQFGIISRYISLAFWPYPQVLDYGVWLAKAPGEIWPYAIFITLLVIGTLWLTFKDPRWGYAGLFFWLTLGPTSSVVPLVTQTATEHRMYLPLAGLIPLIVIAFSASWTGLIEKLRRKRWDVGPLIAFRWLLAGGAIAGCFWLTWERNRLYQDPVAMWRANVEAWPRNARGHSSLASKLYESGRYAEALAACDSTIEQNPSYPGIYYLKGEIFRHLGRTAEMFAAYAEEIRLHPDHSWSYFNRGAAKFTLGDHQGALADFKEAVNRRPDLADYHFNLGKVQQQLHLDSDAIQSYSETIKLDPQKLEAYQMRGIVYERTDQLQEAEADFSQALEFDTKSVPTWFSRGMIHKKLGKYQEAVADFSRVLQINPQVGQAYEERAKAYLELGDVDHARADVLICRKLGMKLDPEFLKQLML